MSEVFVNLLRNQAGISPIARFPVSNTIYLRHLAVAVCFMIGFN